jgi:hypothetical protein
MDLMDMFKQQMTNQVVSQMAQKVGLSDTAQTQTAATTVFSTLMGAISKNAATEEGAANLDKALERDHDGGMLDNVMSLFGGSDEPAASPKAANGAGILKHVLGGKQEGIIAALSQTNNMSPDATQTLMQSMAPMVMGMLGKAKKEQGLSASSLGGFLQGQKQETSQLSGILSMLDSDGDGSVIDDIGGMLGGMFGK